MAFSVIPPATYIALYTVLKALKLYVPGRLTSPTILTLTALGIPTEMLTKVLFSLIPV